MYYVKHHPLALFPTSFVFSDLTSVLKNISSQGTGAKRVLYYLKTAGPLTLFFWATEN